MVAEYFLARKVALQKQLEYNWIAGVKDISDLIRGRIQIIDEFLEFDKVFDRYEDLKKQVEVEKNKGAK